MPSRHRARQRALQILFQWDMRQHPTDQAQSVDECLDSYYGSLSTEDGATREDRDEFAESLVRGTVAKIADIDSTISHHAEHWRIERMPAVDRNILRLAAYEMKECGTPAAVVINEALELAKRFSAPESPQFINGVLDAVRKGQRPEQSAGAPG